jgi:hypothetical protein
MIPETKSDAPNKRVSSAAASSGFSKVTKPASTETKPEKKFAPSFDLEHVDNFRYAGNHHHDADD